MKGNVPAALDAAIADFEEGIFLGGGWAGFQGIPSLDTLTPMNQGFKN